MSRAEPKGVDIMRPIDHYDTLRRGREELLRQAEARVEKITFDASGKPSGTEPLDVS